MPTTLKQRPTVPYSRTWGPTLRGALNRRDAAEQEYYALLGDAVRAGVPLSKIGLMVGKSAGYVPVLIRRGRIVP